MAQVETTIGADSAAVENPDHATSGRDLSVHDPAATPKSSFAPSDNTKDEIGTQSLQTAAGCTETSDCSNADRCSCAANHGEEHAGNYRGVLPTQQTKPQINHGAEASIAEPPVKAHEASDVTNAQSPRQPEAAGHGHMEAAIVIDDEDDEDFQKQNGEGRTASKPAKRISKKRIPNNRSTSGGNAGEMNADSTQRPLGSAQKLRSSQRARHPTNEESKEGALKSIKRRKPGAKSKTVPPTTEHIVDDTTSTGRPVETATPAPTAERDELLQSGFPRRRPKPVTSQLDKTREAAETDLNMAANADNRLKIYQPEVDGDGRRGDMSDTEVLGPTDGDREVEVGVDAEVGGDAGVGGGAEAGDLDHVDTENHLQAQYDSRFAYTRLGEKHRDLGKGLIDERADSDAELDDTRVAARETTAALRESAKKRKAMRGDASTEIRKRRWTPGFSYQKIRPDVAFRASSSDWTGGNDDVPESFQHFPAQCESNNDAAHGSAPQNHIRSSTTGGDASAVDCREAIGALSETTQEMEWSSKLWHLSNANLRDTSLGESGSIKYEICGHWELAADGELSLSGNTATVWEISIFGSFEFLRNDSTIGIRFKMPPVLRPTVSEI
ncbi:hypothetical protein IF1G_11047 [Cordyceps javanica]|uniref:Uncharacterized protein n=1 Tax=Cordyceps javanica TaxID=43265 RepID=A0A545ULE6_9HYPO|nr:hypothetical protein IF1G_11047 [Cordyceps javanica]TQW01755.1 hypothetical protein IF2G_10737 [Cordyceps javanica]